MHISVWVLWIGLCLRLKAVLVTEIEIITVTQISYTGPYEFNATFAHIMLNHHNHKRKLHHAQQVSWNNTLYDYAAGFANQYDCSGELTHSGGPYGENLAAGYSPSGAIDAWYREGDSYDYAQHDVYNHFTALVWNDTSQMACATTYCGTVWGSYIVCSYYPPGNFVGQSEQNVFPV
ncbi:PR-1-like protein [Yamadazyma tenuis ATCC 10573]|uniref:PR-1-like protein n=1 Tax=Candida tenuis (strain ATCC 10573 / BCRC 21748 / CBS 615 / JCM 9827 / NBRC 10315 / NRRL Y-1498 / VKM Y-70) TaxID=590646 RepID=G3B357_CANTC|nr:PR-1-like protein [Yamadazyma tenuis ATCC 10573]EGV64086.1 PR-1-like protein [Yamadazyma tenuis ATCC 10573]